MYVKGGVNMSKNMYYFAYGSNMDVKRLEERLGRAVTVKAAGRLQRDALRFNKVASGNPREGYANIVEGLGEEVWGVVYEVTEEDLEQLNVYEGVAGGHYYRKKVSVELEDGTVVEAVTYVAFPERVEEGLKPRREYLEHLLAARDILPDWYVRRLEETETLD